MGACLFLAGCSTPPKTNVSTNPDSSKLAVSSGTTTGAPNNLEATSREKVAANVSTVQTDSTNGKRLSTKFDTSTIEKAASTGSITVIQKPLYVERGVFVERQNAHASKGLTEWFFHCYPEFEYKTESNPFSPNKITLTITKVKLTISCPVTVRVGRNDQATIDHENGHVQLVRQVYSEAASAASEAARKILGKQYVGNGATSDEATSDALGQAGQEIGKNYTARTVLVANELSKNFDDITNHGNSKIPVQEAIKQSNERYLKAKSKTKPVANNG